MNVPVSGFCSGSLFRTRGLSASTESGAVEGVRLRSRVASS